MIKINYFNEIPVIQFPLLERIAWLKHGVSTRLGGVSEGIYASMNLGFLNGDSRENVQENYKRICNSIGIDADSMVFSYQTHTDHIRKVSSADCGKGYSKERDYKDIDALITNDSKVTLVIFTADCVPVFLVDTVNHAIGLAHSGWKGTKNKIAVKTLNKMEEEYGTTPQNVLAVTGPCICRSCYEVGDDVEKQFQDAFTEEQFNKITAMEHHVDLALAIQFSLEEAGIKPENISDSGFCTACNSDILFSHRASKGKRGTMASFLKINQTETLIKDQAY